MPSESGVTSSSSMSFVASEPPPRMLACTAAPSATTSSGFRSMCGVRAEEFLHQCADLRNARRSADQHDFVDLLGLEAGIFQGLLAGTTSDR